MLALSKNDVQKAVTMREAINAVEKAFTQYYLKLATIPLRTRIHCNKANGDVLFMPALMDELNGIGIKIVSVFPNNIKYNKPTISAIMLVNDVFTGEPLAIMDATYLTALRTGAASGVATRHLANPNATKVAIFGSGGQALKQLEAVLEERRIQEVYVYDIDGGKAKNFVKACEKELNRFNFHIKQATNPSEAVHHADIIVTATTSKKPVFSGKDIKPGAHINGIGSFTPQMQEIDEITICKANKIVIDSYEASLKEAGDLITPLEKGLIKKENIYSELGKITAGKTPGRETLEEITLFKSVGIAVQDIAVAKIIYENALTRDLGQQLSIL